jgi:inhibitor of cysteine peptidase
MKTKILIMIGILMLLVACTTDAGVFTDPAVPVTVNEGNRFSIELPSNATTGYSWEFGAPIDGNYLTLLKTDYINPNSTLVGAGGTQVWIFKAVHPGSTSVLLEYKRPWEVNVDPIQTAQFNVTIQ